MFDPNAHKPTDNNNEGSKFLSLPGSFVVAFTKYGGRKENANGKEFLKLSGLVIAGEPSGVVGKLFTQRVYLTRESEARLGAMCAAMGWSEPFDLKSDPDVKRAFLNRPFKAKFKVEVRDGNSYAGIAFFEQTMTNQERDAANEWVANRSMSSDGDFDAPDDDKDIPF